MYLQESEKWVTALETVNLSCYFLWALAVSRSVALSSFSSFLLVWGSFLWSLLPTWAPLPNRFAATSPQALASALLNSPNSLLHNTCFQNYHTLVFLFFPILYFMPGRSAGSTWPSCIMCPLSAHMFPTSLTHQGFLFAGAFMPLPDGTRKIILRS